MTRHSTGQKRRNKGPLIIFLFMVLIAMLTGPGLAIFSGFAIKEVLDSPSLEKVNQQRAAIRAWPAAIGQLHKIYIYSVKTHGKYSTDFCNVAVAYDYKLNGQTYKKVPAIKYVNGHLDQEAFDSRDSLRRQDQGDSFNYNCEAGDFQSAFDKCRSRLSKFLKPEDKDNLDEIDKDHVLHTFSVDREIQVFHDPADPSVSTLDSNLQELSWWNYFGSNLLGPVIGLIFGLLISISTVACICMAVFEEKNNPFNTSKRKLRANHSHASATTDSSSEVIPVAHEEQRQVEKPHHKPAP